MKKLMVSILAICLMSVSFCGCLSSEEVVPTEYLRVKQIEISVDSENEFIIDTYNVYLTNSNYEPSSTSILASESVNMAYAQHHNHSSLNKYNHIIESDIGKVKIQFELYLHVNYNNIKLPYIIRVTDYYYTKTQDNQVVLYTDKKCTNEASFNTDAKDIHYSTGEVYNDSYKINLKIIVEKKDAVK